MATQMQTRVSGAGSLRLSGRITMFAAALLTPAIVLATDISVVGLFSNKAVVQVDGGGPRTVAVGQKAAEGVTLVSIEKDGATFEIDGKRKSIKIGQAPVPSRPNSSPSAALTADSRGHFIADGQINGNAIRFIVDTGATLVSLSSADARRLGINYLSGQPVLLNTANGVARAYRVRLDTVRIADITVNGVDAVVMENQAMPALLGMSFLNRMEMRRDGNVMTLTRKY